MRFVIRFEDIDEDGQIVQSSELTNATCNDERYDDLIYTALHDFMKAAKLLGYDDTGEEALIDYLNDEYEGKKLYNLLLQLIPDFDEDDKHEDDLKIMEARKVLEKWSECKK